jgi:enoyl-CoA hydratase/carnithine racemase
LNAVNRQVVEELSHALVDFKSDDEVWVGIITGAGDRAFSVGADIKEILPELKGSMAQWSARPDIDWGTDFWKPMIAAINGAALGGGLELALHCDIRIAVENATFGLPEVLLGIIPGWGGTQRLPRAIPAALAAEMLFTGRPIDAQEAYREGLVNKVVPQAELMSTARKMAEAICRPAPLAVRAAKQAMLGSRNLPLEEGLELERSLLDSLIATEDFQEGYKSFLEKRRPVFRAR